MSTGAQYCRAKDPKTCPYHGNVMKMQEAKANLKFDEFADAREELRRQLATSEFAREEQRREESAQSNTAVSFESVARDQAALEAQVDREASRPVRRPRRAAAAAGDSLSVPTHHTYAESSKIQMPNNPYSWTGSKYDPYMAPSAIVTNIKRDFVNAQKAGYLPKGLSISAQKDQYSGGYGINVEISGVKDKDRYTYHEDGEIKGDNEASKLVEKRIRSIVDAYNMYHRDGPYDDYGIHNFGGSVKMLDDRMQAANAEEKAQAAAARQAKSVAVQLQHEYAVAGPAALQRRGFTITGATRDGKQIGRIPGTRFLAIVQPDTDGQTTYQMFNLHNITERSANAFESQFSHMNAASIRRQFKRQRFIG